VHNQAQRHKRSAAVLGRRDAGALVYGEAGPRSGVRGRSRGWRQLLCPKRHRERPTELTHPHLDWPSPDSDHLQEAVVEGEAGDQREHSSADQPERRDG
jgi:hypothetical protein